MAIPVTKGYKITQNEIGQTAAIVYQTAQEAIQTGEKTPFSINHEEPVHVNLGRTLEQIDELDSSLQERRPGGGGWVKHDNTYCFGYAIPKNQAKTGLKKARHNLGQEIEQILQENFRQNVNYSAEDGDIYVGALESQAVGIGVADINEEFGNATIVRACMYPENSGTIYTDQEKSDIIPIPNLSQIQKQLEEGFDSVNADEFIDNQNRKRADKLQQEDGYRHPEPCFSTNRGNQLKE
jgi:hypothetical protein